MRDGSWLKNRLLATCQPRKSGGFHFRFFAHTLGWFAVSTGSRKFKRKWIGCGLFPFWHVPRCVKCFTAKRDLTSKPLSSNFCPLRYCFSMHYFIDNIYQSLVCCPITLEYIWSHGFVLHWNTSMIFLCVFLCKSQADLMLDNCLTDCHVCPPTDTNAKNGKASKNTTCKRKVTYLL